MKFQAMLSTLFYLLFTSDAKRVLTPSGTSGSRELKATKPTTILHNGYPVEVYGIPQQSFSFHPLQLASNIAPTIHRGPKIALQRDKLVLKKENTYLQDSYGNRFYGIPQNLAYKMIYPQEVVALQDLPAQLSQPIIASPTKAQASFSVPHFTSLDAANLQAFLNNDKDVYHFPTSTQSFPIVFPQQNLDVPIETHLKVAESAHAVLGKNHGPITYSYHKPPVQHFKNVSPNEHFNNSYQSNDNDNIQPSNKVVTKNPKYRKTSNVKPQPDNHRRPLKQPHKKVHKQIVVKEEVSTVDPQFYEPQFFADPIVPQVQHYLPKIQNVLKFSIDPKPNVPIVNDPEKLFGSDISYGSQLGKITSRPQSNNKLVINEYSEPNKHEHKEEVKAEIIDEEENDEKIFNEGYDAAAEGFPSFYNSDDKNNFYDEDSYGEPKYHDSQEFSENPDNKRSKYVVSTSLQHNSYDNDGINEFKPIPYNFPFHNVKKTGPRKKQQQRNLNKEFQQNKYHQTIPQGEYPEIKLPYKFPAQTKDYKQKTPFKAAKLEIDYTKGYPSEHKSPQHPRHRHQYRAPQKLQFVEPQFQYGFEPIIESTESDEQISSPSNESADTELAPKTVKKVFKQNWYISKSSSAESKSDTS